MKRHKSSSQSLSSLFQSSMAALKNSCPSVAGPYQEEILFFLKSRSKKRARRSQEVLEKFLIFLMHEESGEEHEYLFTRNDYEWLLQSLNPIIFEEERETLQKFFESYFLIKENAASSPPQAEMDPLNLFFSIVSIGHEDSLFELLTNFAHIEEIDPEYVPALKTIFHFFYHACPTDQWPELGPQLAQVEHHLRAKLLTPKSSPFDIERTLNHSLVLLLSRKIFAQLMEHNRDFMRENGAEIFQQFPYFYYFILNARFEFVPLSDIPIQSITGLFPPQRYPRFWKFYLNKTWAGPLNASIPINTRLTFQRHFVGLSFLLEIHLQARHWKWTDIYLQLLTLIAMTDEALVTADSKRVLREQLLLKAFGRFDQTGFYPLLSFVEHAPMNMDDFLQFGADDHHHRVLFQLLQIFRQRPAKKSERGPELIPLFSHSLSNSNTISENSKENRLHPGLHSFKIQTLVLHLSLAPLQLKNLIENYPHEQRESALWQFLQQFEQHYGNLSEFFLNELGLEGWIQSFCFSNGLHSILLNFQFQVGLKLQQINFLFAGGGLIRQFEGISQILMEAKKEHSRFWPWLVEQMLLSPSLDQLCSPWAQLLGHEEFQEAQFAMLMQRLSATANDIHGRSLLAQIIPFAEKEALRKKLSKDIWNRLMKIKREFLHETYPLPPEQLQFFQN